MKMYETDREELERYVNIGFDLAIKTLHDNGEITDEQLDKYENYCCTSITDKSVCERFKSFFGNTSTDKLVLKFIVMKMRKAESE